MTDKAKCVVLIVLFEKKIDCCSTFLSLLKNENLHLIDLVFWDNSSNFFFEYNSSLIANYSDIFSSLSVLGTGGNVALSSIYNQVFQKAFAKKETAFVVLLDHDTDLPPSYLTEVWSEYKLTNGSLLIVPRVKSKINGHLVSPRRQEPYYCFERYTLKFDFDGVEPSIQDSHKLFAVGSGLVIPRIVWIKGVRFEEKLSFYGVDTEFCFEYSKRFKTFYLSNSTIIHDISEESIEPMKTKLWRFNQHMDYWAFQLRKHSPYPSWFTSLYVACFRKVYEIKTRMKSDG